MKAEPLLILIITMAFNTTFVALKTISSTTETGINCESCIDYSTPESRVAYEDENVIFTKSGSYILKGWFSSIAYRKF